MRGAFAVAALCTLALETTAGTLSAVDLNGDLQTDAYLESTTQTLWYRSADVAGAKRFSAAQVWVDTQEFAGETDWRLPTLPELQALYTTLGSVDGVMNSGPFDSLTHGQYWSSTTSGANIYGLDTRTGYAVAHVDNGASLYVWAVTSAPTASPIPEPSSASLLFAALVGTFLARRRSA